jgi:hypothetical protein
LETRADQRGVIGVTGLNFLNVETIGAAEEWIVAVKIGILLFFVGRGGLDHRRLPDGCRQLAGGHDILAGAMIIFLAYEGFELIANTAGDVREPDRTLPRAYYSAVGFVILLYVMVAAVTVGNLPVAQIVDAKDYALAEAARPFLGSFGYLLITVAALLSTLSAINATLYGAARLSYTIAKDGELARNPGTQVVEPPGGGPSDYQRRHAAGGQFFRSVEHLDHGQYRLPAHFCRRQCRQRPSGPTNRQPALDIDASVYAALPGCPLQPDPLHVAAFTLPHLGPGGHAAFGLCRRKRLPLVAARQSSSRVLAVINRTQVRHHYHSPRRRRSKACLGFKRRPRKPELAVRR